MNTRSPSWVKCSSCYVNRRRTNSSRFATDWDESFGKSSGIPRDAVRSLWSLCSPFSFARRSFECKCSTPICCSRWFAVWISRIWAWREFSANLSTISRWTRPSSRSTIPRVWKSCWSRAKTRRSSPPSAAFSPSLCERTKDFWRGWFSSWRIQRMWIISLGFFIRWTPWLTCRSRWTSSESKRSIRICSSISTTSNITTCTRFFSPFSGNRRKILDQLSESRRDSTRLPSPSLRMIIDNGGLQQLWTLFQLAPLISVRIAAGWVICNSLLALRVILETRGELIRSFDGVFYLLLDCLATENLDLLAVTLALIGEIARDEDNREILTDLGVVAKLCQLKSLVSQRSIRGMPLFPSRVRLGQSAVGRRLLRCLGQSVAFAEESRTIRQSSCSDHSQDVSSSE